TPAAVHKQPRGNPCESHFLRQYQIFIILLTLPQLRCKLLPHRHRFSVIVYKKSSSVKTPLLLFPNLPPSPGQAPRRADSDPTDTHRPDSLSTPSLRYICMASG